MSSQRERDLVLAPNEFAYISDQTKGHIIAYVGPFKTSMANTDQPVYFDQTSKRFIMCSLEDAIKNFTVAPEGWYIELKNPAKDGNQPNKGTSNNAPDLAVGRKVNIPGPTFFALWPGQMARVMQGHHLRSNQYLVVRVYDEIQAQQNWTNAVIKPQNTGESPESTTIPTEDTPDLTMGQLLVIRGTDVSFYIPPTGIEVVRDLDGYFIREAVTLERLEYCILLDEDGNKRYIKGSAVVFPEPTESFVVKKGKRKFKAVELNEISGIYLKVIAPYEEDGKSHQIGEELFITGKEQMIYFPRPEHALIKYGEREIYHAVAIPPGEGRYYLNRMTGKVSLKRGPAMFLPDPREAVIVNRVLTDKQVKLWFPKNQEALEHNRKLRKIAQQHNSEFVEEKAMPKQKKMPPIQQARNIEQAAGLGLISDEFAREEGLVQPRTITLDDKYSGAVTVDVWTGYAVQVVSKTGERKVIAGPQTYLLEYDENMQTIELSTGTPKTEENLFRTVYLRALHNKVSDLVEAESKDFCEVEISLSYRVNFTGESEKWFNVENYVKFLTDHMRSVIRNAMKQFSIIDFYADGISILRDIILGVSEDGKRTGRLFKENGMHIYDVEILEITLLDDDIELLISKAQHEEVKHKIAIEAQNRKLEFTKKNEEIQREIEQEKSHTKQENFELRVAEIKKQLLLNLEEINGEIQAQQAKLSGDLNAENIRTQINTATLEQKSASQDLELEFAEKLLEQKILELQADSEAVIQKAEAVSPDLIAALQAFSDRALAEKMAETMAPLSILGGKSIAEVFSKMLKGTSLEDVLLKKALPQNPEN